MTDTFKINIGRKDLYSKKFNSAKKIDYDKRNTINISKSLIDIFSIIINESK